MDKTWTRLSPNVEVLCLADYFQDSSDVLRYFAHYLLRNPLGLSAHQIETQASFQFRLRIPRDARFFRAAKRAYHFLKSR